MSSVPVFVGLDYHQDSVQVCVLDGAGRVLQNDAYGNDASLIATVVERHGTAIHAAIESCTGAADLADELAQRNGWMVDLAHPGFVRRMKQNPDKTDFSDARMLADLERVGYLRRSGASSTQGWLNWLKKTKEVSEESQWILKQQVKRLLTLRREIGDAERRLTRVTRNDSLVAALQKQKGVGPVTAWTIRAEIGRFERFRTGKQLARFCGLSPRNASSGQRQADAGLIKAGNPELRATLMEAAHRLIRFEEPWKEFAAKLLNRGKPKCVVVAAAANRWMRWLFHQMQPDKLAPRRQAA